MNTVFLGVLVYVALQLLVGVMVSRRITNEADYLLAGRSFGYGLATFSMFATWFGAETCIGSAGAIYQRGMAGASADPFGYGACLFLMGLIFARPLWRRKLTTLADLFRERFSPGVERATVLLMAPTSILWAAAQIRAFGQVLDTSSGIGVGWGIALGAGVTIIYTVSGGLRADVLTDLIQGIAIIIGLVAMLVIILPTDAAKSAWHGIDPARWNLFDTSNRSVWNILESWAVPICGSVVAQELVSRVIATRSPRVAQRSAIFGGFMYLGIGLIPAVIGLLGAQMFPGLNDPERILPLVAQKHLSTFFYILFTGALVSAILSTVDSTLLAASALVSHNLIVAMKPTMPEAQKLRFARLGVIGAGLIAYGLALQAESIYGLVESASSFGSAGILVIVVFGLFTKIGSRASAFSALSCGVLAWLAATYLVKAETPYLLSLGAALAGYLAFGGVRHRASKESILG